jgi:hypothetical protein
VLYCRPQAALPLACGYENYVPLGLAVAIFGCPKDIICRPQFIHQTSI